MKNYIAYLAASASGLLAFASFITLIETNVWWVRMADFPRLHYLVLLLASLVFLVWVGRQTLPLLFFFGALGASAALYNGYKLYPYLPGTGSAAARCEADKQISILVANVRLQNRSADPLLEIIRSHDPDLVLALETNKWWDQALAPLEDRMPHTVKQITGGYFGMHLFSRLPLSNAQILKPADQDTPAIVADIELPSGASLRFMGLHPRPPHPGQRSVGRDAQLMWAALSARGSERPVILAGDLNAVPWEKTNERLQRVGGFIDPRQSYGYNASYDAKSWWMYWPLDQVLHQDELTAVSFEVLPGFGSDHYPILVALCARPAPTAPPALEGDDLEQARHDISLARTSASQ